MKLLKFSRQRLPQTWAPVFEATSENNFFSCGHKKQGTAEIPAWKNTKHLFVDSDESNTLLPQILTLLLFFYESYMLRNILHWHYFKYRAVVSFYTRANDLPYLGLWLIVTLSTNATVETILTMGSHDIWLLLGVTNKNVPVFCVGILFSC